jgi:hypothetical protein
MPNGQSTVCQINLDEAVAPYFASVHVELISIVQGFALYMLVQQNVVAFPSFTGWDWPYFLRGLTVFLLAIALWHAYVTQLAYVATLHWAHTLFPFLFGVLQFMLANQNVLKPSTDWRNLSYFIFLVSMTAVTGAVAYFNTWYQHKNNRTRMCFESKFGKDAEQLYSFWGNLHIAFCACMFAVATVLFALAWLAKSHYKTWYEILFPSLTSLFSALAIYIDARFCATHAESVRQIYENVYKKSKK